MRNREITFIIRMRNEARQALSAMTGDLRNSARAAGQAAAANTAAARSMNSMAAPARQAAAAVQSMQNAMGGSIGTVNRHTGALRGWMGVLVGTIRQMLMFGAAFAVLNGLQAFTSAIITQGAAWQMMGARIRLATKSGEEAAAVQEELFQISQRTHQPVEAAGTLYFRMAQSLNNLGYSQKEVLTLTELVGQTMVISGARTEEAAGALIQFSQALASNRFSGDELRSVLEQAPALAQTLVAGLTKTSPDLVKKYGIDIIRTTGEVTTKQREFMVGALRDAGKAGELTTKVITDALLTQVSAVNEKFKTIPILVPMAFQNVKNAFQKELAEIDMMFNLNGGFGKGLLTFADSVIPLLSSALQPVADAVSVIGDAFSGMAAMGSSLFGSLGISAADFARALGTIATALILFKGIPAIFGMIAQFMGPMLMPIIASLTGAFTGLLGILRGGIMAAGLALRGNFIGIGVAAGAARTGIVAMGVALMANPLGLLIGALQIAATLLLFFRDKSVEVGGKSVLVGELVGEAWDRTVKFIGMLFTDLMQVVGAVTQWIGDTWQNLTQWLGAVWKSALKVAQGVFSAIGQFAQKYITPVFKWIAGIPQWYANGLKTVFHMLGGFFQGALNMMGDAVGVFNSSWGDAMKAAGGRVNTAFSAVGDTIGELPAMAADVGGQIGENIGDGIVEGFKFSTPGMILKGAIATYEYLGQRAGVAYGDNFLEAVAQRSVERQKLLGAGAAATPDLTTKTPTTVLPREEDEDGKAEKADKAAKAAAARIRDMTNNIKSLASAYNPYLASLAKEDETLDKLNRLKGLSLTNTDEFVKALDRAGIAAEEWNTLVWQVEAGIKSSDLDGFLKRFTVGGEQAAQASERLKDTLFFDKLSKAATSGGPEYVALLKQLGWSADQATAALERFKATGGIDMATTDAFFSRYIDGFSQIREAEAQNAADAVVGNQLMAKKAEGAAVWEAYLKSINVTLAQGEAALDAYKKGFNFEQVDTARSSLEGFMTTYGDLSTVKIEALAVDREMDALEQLRLTNIAAFNAALVQLGLTYADYEAARQRAMDLQRQEPGLWDEGKRAADAYIQDVKKNGMTLEKAFGNTFKSMEDALVSFITTGKVDFKSLVDGMIADLARLFAQQMMMKVVTSVFGMPFASGGVPGFAKGGAFGPVQEFAKGSSFANKVFNQPTFFEFARQGQKKLGVMGEAGPEAIMPLKNKGGNLSVTAYGANGAEQIPLKRGPDGRLGIDRDAMAAASAFAKGAAMGGPKPFAFSPASTLSPTARTVLPPSAGGGGGGGQFVFSPNVTVTVEGSAGQSQDQQESMGLNLSNALVQSLKGMVMDVINNEKRPGGTLAA